MDLIFLNSKKLANSWTKSTVVPNTYALEWEEAINKQKCRFGVAKIDSNCFLAIYDMVLTVLVKQANKPNKQARGRTDRSDEQSDDAPAIV